MTSAEKLGAMQAMALAVSKILGSIEADNVHALEAESPNGIAGALMPMRQGLAVAVALVDGALAFHAAVRS